MLAISLFLCGTAAALAQTASTSDSEADTAADRESVGGTRDGAVLERLETRQEERTELIEERQTDRAERIETRQTIREDRQVALTEIRQQRILNLSANISNRMDAAIDRLFTIVERLESRIQKMNESGIDTQAATAKVREAAEQLARARALMGEMDTLVFNATTAQTPVTAWSEVRGAFIEVGTLIRAGHRALREAIALLKTTSIPPEEPTTVASSTNDITE